MDKYIIWTNNAGQIHNSDLFINKCVAWTRLNLAVYRSFPFANCTCYMKTVSEEIEFVIQCQKNINKNILDVADFVDAWQIKEYLQYDIISLSVGWKKYLGIALFTNQISQGKLYLDAARHLSDRLLDNLMHNLDLCKDKVVIFAEYDIKLLSQYRLTRIYDHLDRLSLDKWQAGFLYGSLETNYE